MSPEHRMKTDCLSEFLSIVRDCADPEKTIYRGQTSDTWRVGPRLLRDPDDLDGERKLSGKDATRIEARLFNEFSDYLTAFRPDLVSVGGQLERPAQQWRQLALAQHYGVPTRFTDFTRSSLAALCFAVEEPAWKEHDSAVWLVEAPNRLRVWQVPQHATEGRKQEELTPVELSLLMLWFGEYEGKPKNENRQDKLWKACREVRNKFPKLKEPSQQKLVDVAFVPDHVDARMAAQGSLFMYELSYKRARLHALLGKKESTHKIVIPLKHRSTLRDQLHQAGVNRASLFPDLAGAATHLSWSVYKRKRGYTEMGRIARKVGTGTDEAG